MAEYVALRPIAHGHADGERETYQKGDVVNTSEMSDETVMALRADGTIVPKQVWDELKKADDAKSAAQAEVDKAEAEMRRLSLEDPVVAQQRATVAEIEQAKIDRSQNERVAARAERPALTDDEKQAAAEKAAGASPKKR